MNWKELDISSVHSKKESEEERRKKQAIEIVRFAYDLMGENDKILRQDTANRPLIFEKRKELEGREEYREAILLITTTSLDFNPSTNKTFEVVWVYAFYPDNSVIRTINEGKNKPPQKTPNETKKNKSPDRKIYVSAFELDNFLLTIKASREPAEKK